MSSGACGGGSRAAAQRRNSRIALYPLAQVAAARQGWSGPAIRANPAAHAASRAGGPEGRQLTLPLAATDPPAGLLLAAPPGFPVQQVVRVGLVPVPAPLP